MGYTDAIEARIETLHRNKWIIRKKLASLPKGEIRIMNNAGYMQFYRLDENGNRRYIPKSERKLALELIESTLCKYRLSVIDSELELLNEMMEKYRQLQADFSERIKPKMIRYQNVLSELTARYDEEVNDFLRTSYVKAPNQECCTIETKGGLIVRSKAEGNIADSLDAYGLPYLYEKPYYFTRDGRGRTIFLDFTIMNPITHEIVGWTHMGRMDDPSYVRRNETHIADLCKFGFIPGDNLIVTFEGGSHRLSSAEIEEIIVRYFPGIEQWSL